MASIILLIYYWIMARTGADSDPATVREDGTIEGDKRDKGEEAINKKTVMSLLRSHDTVPSSPDIFDRSFSGRSSVGESSPFRKLTAISHHRSYLHSLWSNSAFGP